MAGRKNGSILIALILAICLGVFGLITIIRGGTPSPLEYLINGGSCIVFSIVLLWWVLSHEDPEASGFNFRVFYRNRNFGLGFETITTTVTVVTAVIAIFALTNEYFN